LVILANRKRAIFLIATIITLSKYARSDDAMKM